MSCGDDSAPSQASIDGGWPWTRTGALATPVLNPKIAPGDDYEYDEAHDVSAGPLGGVRGTHRVDPPEVNLGAGGDYQYDEAHDFGASSTTKPDIAYMSELWRTGQVTNGVDKAVEERERCTQKYRKIGGHIRAPGVWLPLATHCVTAWPQPR